MNQILYAYDTKKEVVFFAAIQDLDIETHNEVKRRNALPAFERWMLSHGYGVANTGGNCLAFEREIPGFSMHVLITTEDGDLPEDDLDHCMAGLYLTDSSECIGEIKDHRLIDLLNEIDAGHWDTSRGDAA